MKYSSDLVHDLVLKFWNICSVYFDISASHHNSAKYSDQNNHTEEATVGVDTTITYRNHKEDDNTAANNNHKENYDNNTCARLLYFSHLCSLFNIHNYIMLCWCNLHVKIHGLRILKVPKFYIQYVCMPFSECFTTPVRVQFATTALDTLVEYKNWDGSLWSCQIECLKRHDCKSVTYHIHTNPAECALQSTSCSLRPSLCQSNVPKYSLAIYYEKKPYTYEECRLSDVDGLFRR